MMRALAAAWSQIAGRPSRMVATVVAIVLGTGFACAALVFTSTFHQDFAARLSVEYSGADVVITSNTPEPVQRLAARIAQVPGVSTAEPLYDSGIEFTAPHAHNYLNLRTFSAQPQLQWAKLSAGRWPAQADQIVVDRDTATAANLPVGTTLRLTGPPGPDDQAPPDKTVTVVGIADTSANPLQSGRLMAFAMPSLMSALGITYAPKIAVLTPAGTDTAGLFDAIQAQFGSDVIVRTVAQQAQRDVEMYGGTDQLATVLLAFAAIALVVAGIVIANTFTILLTQRRRQIALLRCVGASSSQVRREAIAEAGIIGAAGSVLGAAAGIGAGAVAASIAGFDSGGLAVPAVAVAVVTVIGVALTIGAAVVPATRAMRVSPIAALRPVADSSGTRTAGRIRLAAGSTLIALGGVLLAAGVWLGSVRTALPGGALSAVGVLLLTRSFLPLLVRLLGGIGRVAGVPGRLAAANAVRNPGRAAATSAALVVGIGLIVMLQVAAASVGASIDKAATDRYPVDIAVTGDGTALPGELVAGIRATPGLAAAAVLEGAPASVTLADGRPVLPEAEPESSGRVSDSSTSAGTAVTLIGIPAGAGAVVRGGMDALDTGDPALPAALVPSWWVGNGLVQVGDEITVTVGAHAQRFSVAVGHLNDAALRGLAVVTTDRALHALAPDADPIAIWAALDSGGDAAASVAALNSLLATQPEFFVTGSATERASMQSVLGTVTTVATGLLAVAVVIAIVGIGNTIGLSVLERTRESALLRALGLRRGQLRLTLAIEALLLALVGGLVGVALGLVYGWAGAASTFGDIDQELVFRVPWGTVGLVLLLAIAAGVLASVLPARRAARATPVAALVEE